MSDIAISLSGDGAGAITSPTSINITYALNSVPTAVLSLDPSNSGILCDVDANRRKAVVIKVSTKSGCLNFNGVYDGVSMSQSYGGMSYSAVVKSKFQTLMELYPVYPGVSPMGTSPYERVSPLIMTAGDASGTDGTPLSTFIQSPSADKTIIQVYIDMIEKMIDFGVNLSDRVTNMIPTTNPVTDLLKGYDKKTLQKEQDLIAAVSTQYTDGYFNKGNIQASTLQYIATHLIGNDSTLWGALVGCLGELGCNLVIGNNTAFIVPENNFIALPRHGTPSVGKRGSTDGINIAYPADYNGLNINDNGFMDIGNCFIYTGDSQEGGQAGPDNARGLGRYSDPKKSSDGVLFLPATGIWLNEVLSAADLACTETNKAVSGGKPYLQALVTKEDLYKSKQTTMQKIKDRWNNDSKQLYDNWAQLLYYQNKFSDRSGSINMDFNTNWVPGASALIYTKYPGVYIDCFVTSVTHSINLQPNGSSATTSVNFQSARINSSYSMPYDPFYNYDAGDMKDFQGTFLGDISNSGSGSGSGGLSTGGLSTGGLSTGGLSTGGLSTGGLSTGGL